MVFLTVQHQGVGDEVETVHSGHEVLVPLVALREGKSVILNEA
jgi:hypothetical protein